MLPRTCWPALSGLVLTVALLAACRRPAEQPQDTTPQPADATVRSLADRYLAAYFERNPDQLTYFGVPNRHHDRLPDNSLDALKAWEAKQDAWLAEARAIDRASIANGPMKATHAI